MILAEIDLLQIVIIVIAMVGGFFQWLWGLLQQGKQNSERELSPEEKQLREEAWRKQTQPAESRPTTPPPVPPFGGDPWQDYRDLFKKVRDVVEKPTPAPAPKAQEKPQRPRPHTVRAELHPPAPPPVVRDVPFPASSQMAAPLASAPKKAIPGASPAQADVHGLAGLLLNASSLRQAFMLREILGPPKALQSSSDSTF